MTNQGVYDKVKTHLLTQNKKSMLRDGVSWAYYGDDGLRCSIGCLIPIERYSVNFERLSCTVPEILTAAGLSEDQCDLARKLQCVHDNCVVEDWESELKDVAKKFCLNP